MATKRDQSDRVSSSHKTEPRTPRRYTPDYYLRKSSYRDSFLPSTSRQRDLYYDAYSSTNSRSDFDRKSFSSRNLRRREADYDFDSFQDGVRRERHTPTRSSKKSYPEYYSRSFYCESYANSSSSFEQDLYSHRSFVHSCKEKTKKRKEKEKAREEKENEIKRKERQEASKRENERILRELEKAFEKAFEKQKENEKGNEKKFESEKEDEKEIETKETSDSEEKESSEKTSEQVRIISTNPPVRSSCELTFQVPRSLCDQFHLHYLPNERCFRLFEKGKFANDYHPLAIEGKEGKDSLFIESKSLDLDNFCSLTVVNDFVLKGAIYSFFYDDYYIGKFVDNIGLVFPKQILNMFDQSLSRKNSHVFDPANFLNSCVKSLCLNMPAQLICDKSACLKSCMFVKNSLFGIHVKRSSHDMCNCVLHEQSLSFCAKFPCSDLHSRLILLKYEPLHFGMLGFVKSTCVFKLVKYHSCGELIISSSNMLLVGIPNQVRVFKPGICYMNSFYGNIKRFASFTLKLCLLEVRIFDKKVKFNDLGFNFDSFINHLVWPHLKFSFHFEKVRPTYVFGIESNFHGNFPFPFKSIVFDNTNPSYFCEFHPSRSKTCHGASPPIQIYRSNRFVLRYLSKERRFILTEKGKPNPQFSSLHIRQGKSSENFQISLLTSIEVENSIDWLFGNYLYFDVMDFSFWHCDDVIITLEFGDSPHVVQKRKEELAYLWPWHTFHEQDKGPNELLYSIKEIKMFWMRNNVFKCLPSFSTNYPLIQLSFHVCNDGLTKLFDKFMYACFVQLRFLAYVRLNEYFMNYRTHLNLTPLSFFLLAVVRIFQVCVTSSIPFDRGKPCTSQSSPMDKQLDLRTSRLKEEGE